MPPDKWLEVRPEGVRLALEGIGHFLITPDDKVLIDPLPEAGTQDLLFALTGVVMGVVLGRRGKHVFHAGVVEIGGRAVAFTGRKEAGKSTLAGAFLASGHTLLSEEILALTHTNGCLQALPGFPHLRLRGDSAEVLEKPARLGQGGQPVFQKALRPIGTGLGERPVPLGCVYVLEFGEQLQIVPLEPREALWQLVPHWYGAQFGIKMIEAIGPDAMMQHAATLARLVPVRLLRRPRSLAELPDVVRRVEDDLEQE